jgi:hypothetical protein
VNICEAPRVSVGKGVSFAALASDPPARERLGAEVFSWLQRLRAAGGNASCPAQPLSTVMPEYEGRLELTWTNKSLRLLAHEDGSYEWASPSDYRVAEVRLLHSVEAVGETCGARPR